MIREWFQGQLAVIIFSCVFLISSNSNGVDSSANASALKARSQSVIEFSNIIKNSDKLPSSQTEKIVSYPSKQSTVDPKVNDADSRTDDFLHGYVNSQDLIKRAERLKLSLPIAEKDGRFQTMNKRGAAIALENSYIRAFTKFTKSKDGMKILHIDATYGHQTFRAVDAKQSHFVATDSSLDHLSILAARARNLLNKQEFSILKFFYGGFPAFYKDFEDDSFDAILLNRTIHFNSPAEIELTMREVYRILKPGGKLFIIALTPYVRRFKSFITVYKQRVILSHKYPGYVKNLKIFANPEVTSPKQMEKLHNGGFTFFDARILYRLLTENHFFVTECQEFPLGIKSDTWELDGRELVGAIAKKPIPTSLHEHLRASPTDF